MREDGRRKRFRFNDFEKKFLLDCSVEELSELIPPAKALDIRTLYCYGGQAAAIFLEKARKSGKPQRNIRTVHALNGGPL